MSQSRFIEGMESRVFFSAAPTPIVLAPSTNPAPAITVNLTATVRISPSGPVFLNPQPLPP